MQLLSEPTYVNTVILVIITSLVFVFFKVTNQNNEAEHYYAEFEPIKYWILKFCYLIISISFMFNIRFLVRGALTSAYIVMKGSTKGKQFNSAH